MFCSLKMSIIRGMMIMQNRLIHLKTLIMVSGISFLIQQKNGGTGKVQMVLQDISILMQWMLIIHSDNSKLRVNIKLLQEYQGMYSCCFFVFLFKRHYVLTPSSLVGYVPNYVFNVNEMSRDFSE